MDAKLHPHAVARLALHVRDALRDNPEPTHKPKRKFVPTGPAAWEVALRQKVDQDGDIPGTYDEIFDQHTELAEFLIAYYAD